MRSFVLVLVLVLASCREAPRSEPVPPAGEATTRAPAETGTIVETATTDTAEPQAEIGIDEVVAANPVVVRGRARTFENSVTIRLLDANENVLAETHTTSRGEMGHHNPFEAQIWVVRDPGARVHVEAFEYSAKDGSVRSLTRKSVPYDVPRIDVELRFPAGDCTRIAPFRRSLPKTQAMARLLTEALLAGPTAPEAKAGATSPFPRGAAVRSVVLRDGTLTVDFDERLQNVGGSCAALAIRDSVTQTLTRLPSVTRVVITAGGSRDLALQP